jgi:hypothetical protein
VVVTKLEEMSMKGHLRKARMYHLHFSPMHALNITKSVVKQFEGKCMHGHLQKGLYHGHVLPTRILEDYHVVHKKEHLRQDYCVLPVCMSKRHNGQCLLTSKNLVRLRQKDPCSQIIIRKPHIQVGLG